MIRSQWIWLTNFWYKVKLYFRYFSEYDNKNYLRAIFLKNKVTNNEATYKCSLISGSNIFNIGAEKFGSMYETVNSVIKHTKSNSKIKNVDKNIFLKTAYFLSKINLIPLQEYHFKVYGKLVYFDISKAKKILNWQPKFSNIESIIMSYDNYLKIKTNLTYDTYSPHNSILRKGLLKYAHFFF